MRFYFGFSKRFSIKKIIKWIPFIATGLLAFFGIGSINANALTIPYGTGNVKICNYSGQFTDNTCVDGTVGDLDTGYGIAYAYSSSNSTTDPSSKSTWYKMTTNTSGPCTNAQTISFNVGVVLNQNLPSNGSNINNWFNPQALNYNYWQGTVTPTTRLTKSAEPTRALFNGYWEWLSGWFENHNKNTTGLRVTYPCSTGYCYRSCNFISYGDNNLTLNFNCQVPAKANYYWLGINQYNRNGSLANTSMYYEANVILSSVNDPCDGSGSDNSDVTQAIGDWGSNIIQNNNSNTQSITGAISDQTSEIMGGFSDVENAVDGLTDAVNSATSDIMDNQEEINDKLDEANDKLDEIGEGVDRLTCNKLFADSSMTSGYLSSNGSIVSNSASRITDYVRFSSVRGVKVRTWLRDGNICFYNNMKYLINCQSYSNLDSNFIFIPNVPSNAVYFKASIISEDVNYGDSYVEYCTNLNGNTTIQSSEVSNFLNQIEEMIDDQPIQRLLSMPITLLNSFYNNVSTTSCSSYNIRLDLPGNNNLPLEFTCPNYNDLIGSSGATLLDAFMCFVLCWGIAHSAIHFYEECSSAKDTFDELYKGGK